MLIAVVGNDKKQLTVASTLREFGYETVNIADNNIPENTGAVVLPVPSSKDDINICGTDCSADYIKSTSDKGIPVFGNLKFHNTVDVTGLDDFAFKNAVPTAEAAIMLAIMNTDFTLWKSKILITGFGRIGKILFDRLKNFGADISLTARNDKDLSIISTYGIEPLKTGELEKYISEFDVIFNTVEYPVFTNSVISKAKTNAVFIELASGNRGFEKSAKENPNIKFISALGLPGKYSYITAGKIYAETVNNILQEKGGYYERC